jgi:lipopolysaccharide export system protein LptA
MSGKILPGAGLLAAALAAILLIPRAPAHAQDIARGFAGFSQKNNQPIKIEADSLEVLDDRKIAIFSGNVKASQGKFVLVSKRIKVFYSGSGGGQKGGNGGKQGIKRIEAAGKVAITTPDGQKATSDWARFEVAERLVTIGGNVVLSQGKNVMRGTKLVIDLKNGRSRLDSAPVASKAGGGRKRITGFFMPGAGGTKNPFGGATKTRNLLRRKNGDLRRKAPRAPARGGMSGELPWKKSMR